MNEPVAFASRNSNMRKIRSVPVMALIGMMSMSSASLLAADESAAALAASAVPGSTPRPAMTSQPAAGSRETSLKVGFGGIGKSEVGDAGAAYDMNWAAVEFGFGSLQSSLTVMNFEWDQAEGLLAGSDGDEPWDRLYQLNVGWTRGGMLSERAMYEVIVGAVAAFERQVSDSYGGYAGAYAMYALDSRWTFTAGALYSKHRKVSTQFDFLPIVGIMWNQQSASGPSFAIGFPSTDVTWRFSDKTSLRLEVSSIESGIYRLADHRPEQQEAYVEFRSTTAALRFDTEVGNGIGLHFGISRALDREIRLYDGAGAHLDKYDVEKRIGLSAAFSWSFGS